MKTSAAEPAEHWHATTDTEESVIRRRHSLLRSGRPRRRNESEAVTRRARLLLVDDDESFLDLAREYGRRQLIEVLCAKNREEALEVAKSGKVHGAVVDVWLGPDSSFDLAHELCLATGNPDLPLAFISGDAGTYNRIAAARAGAALFLTKPLTETRLAEAVSQLLALGQARGSRAVAMLQDAEIFGRVQSVLCGIGLSVHEVRYSEKLLPLLESTDYDAVVLGADAGGVSGVDMCRILRTNPLWQDVSVIFIGPNDDALRLSAISAGADDYIAEPLDEEELRIRVKSRVERRQILRARLERDGLTGLALRRAFMDGLRSRISEAHRRARTLAICILDLDLFKNINDVHGHLAGDRVLANLGRLLSSDFREEDLRARWGGEEFALAFPAETAASIRNGVYDLLEDFKSIRFVGEGGREFYASFSAGLAEYPRDAVTCEGLIRIADERLYRAKRLGRSRVVGGEQV